MLTRNSRNVFVSPNTFGGVYNYQAGNFNEGGRRAIFWHFDNKSSSPSSGTLAPSAYTLPQKAGGLASQTQARFQLTPNVDLIPAYPMDGSSTFTLSVVDAVLDQIVSAVASSLITLSKLDASLSGAASAIASSSFTLSKLDALCGAIISVTINGQITLSVNANLTALGFMIATDGGPAPLSPEGLALELLDTQQMETGVSLRQAIRLLLATQAGKVSGGGTTTITIRDINDVKNRIIATVDANGNRTSITKDVT